MLVSDGTQIRQPDISLTVFLEHPMVRTAILTITIISSVITIFPQGFKIPDNIFLRFGLLVISAAFFGLLIAPRFSRPRIPIYEFRMKFMKYYLKKFIRESKKNVRILSVIFGWFNHIEKEIQKKMVNDGVYFEILILKRIRKKTDISYYSLRESDENAREILVRNMNATLFRFFEFLVKLAYNRQHIDGTSAINKFQIKEYAFLPVMCAYIFDDKKLVFGPYLAKDCHHIPLFQIEEEIRKPSSDISMAFYELMDHYNILSDNERRPKKEYIKFFSFFDGEKNSSIHKFIVNNYNIIEDILTNNKKKYIRYLDGEEMDGFNDQYVKALGEKNLEGRFDAVIRDINRKVQKRLGNGHNIVKSHILHTVFW